MRFYVKSGFGKKKPSQALERKNQVGITKERRSQARLQEERAKLGFREEKPGGALGGKGQAGLQKAEGQVRLWKGRGKWRFRKEERAKPGFRKKESSQDFLSFRKERPNWALERKAKSGFRKEEPSGAQVKKKDKSGPRKGEPSWALARAGLGLNLFAKQSPSVLWLFSPSLFPQEEEEAERDLPGLG